MSEQHEHTRAPANPSSGDRIVCGCGYAAEFVVLDDGLPGEWVDTSDAIPAEPVATVGATMSESSAEKDARCPVCGEVGVKACVDSEGRELDHDHEGRPPFFPPGFERIFPPARP